MKKFKIDDNYTVFYKGEEFIFETNAGVAYTNYNVDDVANDLEGTETEEEFLRERELVESIVREDKGYEFDIEDMGTASKRLAEELGWF